jgi:hypothetical protein
VVNTQLLFPRWNICQKAKFNGVYNAL